MGNVHGVNGRMNNWQEQQTGADLNSDGTIAGHNVNAMHDPHYGGMIVKSGGDERFLTFYERKVTPRMNRMEHDVQNTLNRLDDQIAHTSDPAQKRELEGIKEQIQQEWNGLEDNPPALVQVQGHGVQDLVSFQNRWESRLDKMSNLLHDAQTSIGEAGAHANSGGVLDGISDAVTLAAGFANPPAGLAELAKKYAPMIDRLLGRQGANGAERAAETHGTSGTDKSSGTHKADKADKADKSSKSAKSKSTEGSKKSDGKKSMTDVNVTDLMNLMSTDPQAAMEELKSVKPEERAALLQEANTQLQQTNELFSMMSNMMKSQHDTLKAVINNMRV